ncbi:helix-turn-helix domain-containing protein [Kitasatospora nipponensis]|uniref:Helix-turn-helix domain-containing protein n=1 Tax=Kitasatospora nipponensis TaxID=258049 RepID=A0ABN1WQM6_9ACTN
MDGSELSTTDVPKGERFAWWYELVARDLAPAHHVTEHRGDFRASAAAWRLGSVGASAFSCPPLRSVRTPELIRRSDPELWELGYVVSGTMSMEQDRSWTQVRTGDLLLYDTSRPFTSHVLTDNSRVTILHLPKAAVPLPAQALRGLLSRRLPAHGTGGLLAGLLRQLTETRWSALEAEHLGSAAVQLACAFLGGMADREGLLPPETRQSVLLHEVKAFIRDHLTEPQLSPQTIADAHCISVRHLHYLFGTEERTVSTFIRRLRLDRCRADLVRPGLAKHPVGTIGTRWGFADATTFSRAFRTAYGLPPGEYRRLAGMRRSPGENTQGTV